MLTPFDVTSAMIRTWQMQTQAAMVIGLRVAGMAGAWALPPGERSRMVAEKQVAFAKAGQKMAAAMVTGAAPLAIYQAGLAPIARKTKANTGRLGRRAIKG
ncbi:MAG: antifreeze protein [Pseudomonadota bacterium]